MKSSSSSSFIVRCISIFPLCGRACRRCIHFILILLLILLPFHEYYQYRFELTQWDLLLFTGLGALILGLYLAGSVDVYFTRTVERLLARGSLKLNAQESARFFDQLEVNARNWSRGVGVVVAVAMLVAFAIALSQDFTWPRAVLGIGETIFAYVAGNHLGRMVSYGLLGWQLKSRKVEVVVQPFHVDGVAGLKPVGDFYFYQAMVAAIPAIYLAVWWFLFPVWPRDYTHWENAYLVLLSIALLIEILAFMIPIWAFHRVMTGAKETWLEEADRLSSEICDLERRKESLQQPELKEALSAQIEVKTQRYWAIERMQVWPVDMKTKKRFKLNNVFLFIPLLGDIAKRTIEWKDVIELFKRLS
jgi:hypothetical protein